MWRFTSDEGWGFTDGNYQVPDADTLKATLELVDPSLIDYDKEIQPSASKRMVSRLISVVLPRVYILQDYGYLRGEVCDKRPGKSGRKCPGIWYKTRWQLVACSGSEPDSEDEYRGVLETKDKPLLHPAVMSAILKKTV